MNSAPPLLAGAVLLLVGLVTVGRWLLVDTTAADNLINRALTWNLGAAALCAVAAVLDRPDLGLRLYLSVGVLALSNGIGCAILLAGADPRLTRVRQRRYDTCAALFGAVVAIYAFGNEIGVTLPVGADWDAMLWWIVEVFIAWFGLLFVRAALAEFRAGMTAVREKLTYSALLFFGAYCTVSAVRMAVGIVAGVRPGQPGIFWSVGTFVALALIALLIAIPMFEALLARFDMDREGRQCRRLQPLWRDLTAAVPEVVLPIAHPDRGGSSSRPACRLRPLHFRPSIDQPSCVTCSPWPASGRALAPPRRTGSPHRKGECGFQLFEEVRGGQCCRLLEGGQFFGGEEDDGSFAGCGEFGVAGERGVSVGESGGVAEE